VSIQAQTFLARVVPWPTSDTDPGHIGIWWLFQPKNHEPDKRLPWFGHATRSVDEAVQLVDQKSRERSTRDIYVCMSSQRIYTVRQIGGKNVKAAAKSQENAVGFKSLWIDLDVDPTTYPTQDEAIAGLMEFMELTGLPLPNIMVQSGSGGLHLYWVLDRVIGVSEWSPLAHALVEATRRTGFKVKDTGCTTDAARVLRVPGTSNFKRGMQTPVELIVGMVVEHDYTVEEISALLAPYRVATPRPQAMSGSATITRLPTATNELSAGVEARGAALVDLATVKPGCGFVAEALDTGGAAFGNDLWNLTTMLATFAEGGREQAHAMARGHATYAEADTDELFDRKVRERSARDMGWPTCAAIAAKGSTHCVTCPFRAAGKSPLNLARPRAPAPADDLPAGYARNADGTISRGTADEQGTTQFMRLSSYPMTSAWLQDNPWTLHFSTINGRDRHQQIHVPADACASRETLQKLLARQGVVVRVPEAAMMMEFFVSWIARLQQVKDAVVSTAPFGWSIANGQPDGFTYAGKVWGAGTERAAALPNTNLGIHYTPRGTIGPWSDAAKIITDQQRPALDAIVAASFGAPLMMFTGHSGLICSAYSQESGIGKSTAMQVAQAVWGDPVKAMQALDDTQNSVLHKIGQLRHLPLMWDELKTEQHTHRFVGVAFQLTQGKEKSRLTSEATYRDPGSWQTMLVVASNDSLSDYIARMTKTTPAGLYRVFEFTVPPGPPSTLEPGAVQRKIGELRENFGNAGLIYAKYIGANSVSVAHDVAKAQDKIGSRLGAGNEERFWIAAITCIYCGARLSNSLGLTAIDLNGLMKFLLDTFAALRSNKNTSTVDMRDMVSVANVLSQYFKLMRARNTLFTNFVHVGRGRPPLGHIHTVGATDRLETLVVHFGVQDKVIRLSSTHFREWLVKNGYAPGAVLEAAEREFGLRPMNGRLGGGTAFSGGNEYLLEMHLAGSPVADMLIEDTVATP
jgi:hypothetical protein